jgi:predicted RNase H-like HicB family nuclease
MQAYPVVVDKDLDSDYGTVVPDLPGCHSESNRSRFLAESAIKALQEKQRKDVA